VKSEVNALRFLKQKM